MLKRDKSGAVRFAPLHGQTAAKRLAGRPELTGVDSMIWIDPQAPRSRARPRCWRSRATSAVSGECLRRSCRFVPASLRDALYDLVARSRYRIFGRYDACPLPPAENRSRFLS